MAGSFPRMDDRLAIARDTHRVARRRRRVVAGALVSAILVLALVAGVLYLTRPSSRPQALAHGKISAPRSSTTTSLPPTTTSSTTTTTDPGTLPQTNQFPAADTPQFTADMQALWNGVVQGSVQPALTAFFPRSAYVQLKTGIYDPAGDWTNRLVADYALDIQAAHALIASRPFGGQLRKCVRAGAVRALDRRRHLWQRHWLLRGRQLASGVPIPGTDPVLRHRLHDLVARRVVRGASRRHSPVGIRRRRGGSRGRTGVLRSFVDLLTGRVIRRSRSLAEPRPFTLWLGDLGPRWQHVGD